MGTKTFEILLIEKKDEVYVTEAVLTAAARNRLRGYQIIELLIDRKGEWFDITKAVTTAATKGDDCICVNAIQSLWCESRMKRGLVDDTA